MHIALTAVVGLLVARSALARNRLRENLAIIRQYRPWHILAALPLAAAVIGVASGLRIASPVFDLNPILWVISKLFHAGNGNGQPNLILSGLNWKWYAVAFLPLLALAVPRFAQLEEETYRKGTKNWLSGTLRSLLFGLEHMIMLIPFGVSLALTIAGLWFTRQYFKGGTERSTLYHAAFNTTIIAGLFAWVLFT